MKIQSPYTKGSIEYKKSQILKCFPFLQNCQCEDFVSIYRYISHVPECFYNEEVFLAYFEWLKSTASIYHEDLVKYFSCYEDSLSNAIRNNYQINKLQIHNDDLKGEDDYNLLEVIDIYIHPNYLRIVEGIFAPLIHPIAYLSRIHRNVSPEKLDVYNLNDCKSCRNSYARI